MSNEGQQRRMKEDRAKDKKKESRKTPLEMVSSTIFGAGYRV
jgi:hypothetical protein